MQQICYTAESEQDERLSSPRQNGQLYHCKGLNNQVFLSPMTFVFSKVASTTWIAEFLKLDSKRTHDEARYIIKRRLAITKRKYQKLLSDPSSNMVIFSTVRHPLERYLLSLVELLHCCPLIGQELHSDGSVTKVFSI